MKEARPVLPPNPLAPVVAPAALDDAGVAPSRPAFVAGRRRFHGPARAGLLLLGVVVAGLAGSRWAVADSPRDTFRYPYDPVCSWGRVANGRGMIVRCLTRAEAESLGAGRGVTTAPVGSAAPAPEASAAPTGSAAAPATLVVDVGPVDVDTGALPVALRKLKAPADRYLACVVDHGGLTAAEGEVKVRFLVRERGRAEGAVVSKRAGVSEAAARCVADVVDRRLVGSPEAPMVGATLTVKFRESRP